MLPAVALTILHSVFEFLQCLALLHSVCLNQMALQAWGLAFWKPWGWQASFASAGEDWLSCSSKSHLGEAAHWQVDYLGAAARSCWRQ
jgi:hypothetical protein